MEFSETPKYKLERLQLSRNAYLEVGWSKSAYEDDMLKIVIGAESVIIPRTDLETYMLYLAKDPSRFVRSKSQKVEVRNIPVREKEFYKREYLKKQGFIKSHF